MLYNVIKQLNTKNIVAIPADEGLADIAFQEGWRMLIPALPEAKLAKTIMRRESWEWGIYLYDLMQGDGLMSSGETALMADDARFSPYIEDCADDEDDQFDEDLMSEENHEESEE